MRLSLLRPRPAIVFLTVSATLALASRARADDAFVEGTIVALDGGELVVDVGTQKGALLGDVGELFRPLVLRHPVTGKPLRDRFSIGRVVLGQVRGALSLANLEGTPTRAPAVGDIVLLPRRGGTVASLPTRRLPAGSPRSDTSTEAPPEIVKEPSRSASPPAASATAAVPGAPPGSLGIVDEEMIAVSKLVESLVGTDPVTRIQRYEDAVRARPRGRYARALWEEAALLRAGHLGTKGATKEKRTPRATGIELPERLLAGTPFSLALRTAQTRGVVVHLRAPGEAAYASKPLRADTAGYFRVEIPGDLVRAPGLALFLEGTDEEGVATPLVGSAETPVQVLVEPVGDAVPKPPGALVQANVFGEYALYDLGTRQDRAFQTEGSFGLRLGEGQLRAIRSGFGVYRGVGGTLRELDELGLKGRPVGLTYGWLEAEWAPWSAASLIGRVVVGVGRGGVNGGGQGFVRIGHDRRTNLLLGGEILGGVGIRGVAELNWNTLPRVPITLRTEVTNQPAGLAPRSDDDTQSQGTTEIGARAIVQAGYRFTPAFVLYGRASYQGRTIHHAGPGLGAGATYEW